MAEMITFEEVKKILFRSTAQVEKILREANPTKDHDKTGHVRYLESEIWAIAEKRNYSIFTWNPIR